MKMILMMLALVVGAAVAAPNEGDRHERVVSIEARTFVVRYTGGWRSTTYPQKCGAVHLLDARVEVFELGVRIGGGWDGVYSDGCGCAGCDPTNAVRRAVGSKQ